MLGPVSVGGHIYCPHDIASCLPPIATYDLQQAVVREHHKRGAVDERESLPVPGVRPATQPAPALDTRGSRSPQRSGSVVFPQQPLGHRGASTVVDNNKLGRRVRSFPVLAQQQQLQTQLKQARGEARSSKLAPIANNLHSHSNLAPETIQHSGSTVAPMVRAVGNETCEAIAAARPRRTSAMGRLLPSHAIRGDLIGCPHSGMVSVGAVVAEDRNSEVTNMRTCTGAHGPPDNAARLAPAPVPPVSPIEAMRNVDAETEVPQSLFAELMRRGREVRARGQHVLVQKAPGRSGVKLVRNDLYQANQPATPQGRRLSSTVRPRTRE